MYKNSDHVKFRPEKLDLTNDINVMVLHKQHRKAREIKDLPIIHNMKSSNVKSHKRERAQIKSIIKPEKQDLTNDVCIHVHGAH